MPTELPLMDATHELGLSYHQVLRLVLTRKLDGVKRGGHWFVNVASLRRYARDHRA
jgi:hypothetical protein